MAKPIDEDGAFEPSGFVVEVAPGERIHFLDWNGDGQPGVLLIHGLSNTAWSWAPVARRLRRVRRVVAMDLRGHGLSDAPTSGYDRAGFVMDVVAVAEGAGMLSAADDRVVLAGHGFGAIVAVWAAQRLASRCAALVLVDGGWEAMEAASGMDLDEFLRTLDEPPEVMRSISAFLSDRAAFDPATWDGDQERAARATVVETHAGKVVPSTRPHARDASVAAMFAFDPLVELVGVAAPISAIAAGWGEAGERRGALEAASAVRGMAGLDPIAIHDLVPSGHNLMRYRPDAVAAAILAAGAQASRYRPPATS